MRRRQEQGGQDAEPEADDPRRETQTSVALSIPEYFLEIRRENLQSASLCRQMVLYLHVVMDKNANKK